MFFLYLIFLVVNFASFYTNRHSRYYVSIIALTALFMSWVMPFVILGAAFVYKDSQLDTDNLIYFVLDIAVIPVKAILLVLGGLIQFFWVVLFFYSPPIATIISMGMNYYINRYESKAGIPLTKNARELNEKIFIRNMWALGIFSVCMIVFLLSPFRENVLNALSLIFSPEAREKELK